MNHTILHYTVYTSIMKISDCCSSIIGLLPDPSLPMVPALLVGIFIASAILIYLVQKDTKKPLLSVISLFLKQLFISSPINNDEIRKIRLREINEKVGLRWKNQKFSKCSKRLRHAINTYVNNGSEVSDNKDTSDQMILVFHIESLPSIPWWDEYQVFAQQQELLKSHYPKIKKEFLKVFEEFQKGVYKHWCRVELSDGHSVTYPLITRGVINTRNCSICPATFKALADCRVLGLSGCVFGSASFTLLYPDSTIGPTSGDTNVSIKCDLVLETSTKGHLEVAGIQREWHTGEVLLYDAYSRRSLCLATSKNMTVVATPLALLRTSLWHPGLEAEERNVIAGLFAG